MMPSNRPASKRTGKPEAALALLLALGLDSLGEPSAALHPVVWYGKIIRCLEHRAPRGRWPQLMYGSAMIALAAPLALLPTWGVQRLAACISQCRRCTWGKLVYVLLVGASLKPFFALRMLADAGRAVRLPLERGDIGAARQALRSLVSRDRAQLTLTLIAAAAVESLAENVSDSVVAPLFYYSLFGLPGAALYRLCNTFDSMVGYHGRYEYLGKAAARLDDLLNLVPSRLAALLIIVCAPLFGGNLRAAWRIWRRDACKTASPNAGQPMAAMAGALGVQLEKVDHYRLGDAVKTLTPNDIRRAESMVRCVGWTMVCSVVLYKCLCCRSFE